MSGKPALDPALVARARQLAARAAQPVIDLARRHTTVFVERSVLRLARLTGTDPVTGAGMADGGPTHRGALGEPGRGRVRDQTPRMSRPELSVKI